MGVYELRDASETRRYLAKGLWLQRAEAPGPAGVAVVLRRMLELVSGGQPVPPPGFVADVGHLVLATGARGGFALDLAAVPGWSSGLARAYEDLVLGKLDADGSIARGSDALVRYRGRDRDRGLAFLLDRLALRSGFGGVLLNAAALRGLLEVPAKELLASGWESLAHHGPHGLLTVQYEELIAAVRDGAEALGPEDVFELEHGTALAAFGQRVALRQVLQTAAELEAAATLERPRRRDRRPQVATRLLDEDVYPVGGFASISTRGSIESLLHSQLAYMERGERPDLFDIKYVRDELLYYSRDESQFLRRRRAFIVVLYPLLVQARIKDSTLPCQRIVLLLALLVAAVRKLIDWLDDESLTFELLLLRTDEGEPLAEERAVLEMILREPIKRGVVKVESIADQALDARIQERARRGHCAVLTIDTRAQESVAGTADAAHLSLGSTGPRLVLNRTPCEGLEDPWDAWCTTLRTLLESWAAS
jgi:hypothetical protein